MGNGKSVVWSRNLNAEGITGVVLLVRNRGGKKAGEKSESLVLAIAEKTVSYIEPLRESGEREKD